MSGLINRFECMHSAEVHGTGKTLSATVDSSGMSNLLDLACLKLVN